MIRIVVGALIWRPSIVGAWALIRIVVGALIWRSSIVGAFLLIPIINLGPHPDPYQGWISDQDYILVRIWIPIIAGTLIRILIIVVAWTYKPIIVGAWTSDPYHSRSLYLDPIIVGV